MRIKKVEALFNGRKKLIVMIRDVTDSIEFEKMLLKQGEEIARTNLVKAELEQVFSLQCNLIDKLIN